MNIYMNIPEPIKTYIQGILFDAKMITDDKDFNQVLLEEVYNRFIEYANIQIMDKLSDEDLKDLKSMISGGASQQEIDLYVKAALPDYQTIYNQILLDFSDIYLAQGEYNDIADSPLAVSVKE